MLIGVSIAPGAIQTPINRMAWETPAALAGLLRLIPYGRIGLPEDIGRAAVWLASDDADYVHGQTLATARNANSAPVVRRMPRRVGPMK